MPCRQQNSATQNSIRFNGQGEKATDRRHTVVLLQPFLKLQNVFCDSVSCAYLLGSSSIQAQNENENSEHGLLIRDSHPPISLIVSVRPDLLLQIDYGLVIKGPGGAI